MTSRVEVHLDNDHLLLDFDDDDNNTALGKEIQLGQVVDNLLTMSILWYKFRGLDEKEGSAGVPAEPYLFLELRPSGDGVFDVRVAKEQGLSPQWVPLPVDVAPDSETVHLIQPLNVNWRLQSGRRINSLHAKLYNSDGTLATFSRCIVNFSTRSVLSVTPVGDPNNGQRFTSTTLPYSVAMTKK